MDSSRKYKNYHTLLSRIRRSLGKSWGKPGNVTTYLFELFFHKNGIVYKTDLISYLILKEEEALTNDFLKILTKFNFIEWDIVENKKRKLSLYQTFPGKNLFDILEKESPSQKVSQKEFLTVTVQLHQRLDCFDKALRKLIEKVDPPLTEQKLQNYLKPS